MKKTKPSTKRICYCLLVRVFFHCIEHLIVQNYATFRSLVLLLAENIFEIILWSGLLEHELARLFGRFIDPTQPLFDYINAHTISFMGCIIIQKIMLYCTSPLLLNLGFGLLMFVPLLLSYQNLFVLQQKLLNDSNSYKIKVFDSYKDDLYQQWIPKLKLTNKGKIVILVTNILYLTLIQEHQQFVCFLLHLNVLFLMADLNRKEKIIIILSLVALSLFSSYKYSNPYITILTSFVLAILEIEFFRKRAVILTTSITISVIYSQLVQTLSYDTFNQSILTIFMTSVACLIKMTLFDMSATIKKYVMFAKLIQSALFYIGLFLIIFEIENDITSIHAELIFVTLVLLEVQVVLRVTIMLVSSYLHSEEQYSQIIQMRSETFRIDWREDNYLIKIVKDAYKKVEKLAVLLLVMVFYYKYNSWLVLLFNFRFKKDMMNYELMAMMLTVRRGFIGICLNFSEWLFNKSRLINYLIFHIQNQFRIEKAFQEISLLIIGTIFIILYRKQHKWNKQIIAVTAPFWVYLLLFEDIGDITYILMMIILSLNVLIQL